ncbi:MAG: signal recognition particle-docking protein FtsY [Polaromonas sp.]|nr:signal recognition particle-docking protein FtsY [Polaromonas sp.]
MFSFFKKKLRSVLSPVPADTPAQAATPDPADAAGVAAPPAGVPGQAPTALAPSPAPALLPARVAVSGKGAGSLIGSALVAPIDIPQALALAVAPERQRWLGKLQHGLRKTGSSISTVFTGSQIDEQLYEDLETALLLADTGVSATEHLLADVRRRVKEGGMTHPVAVRNALIEAITVLLKPLERPLVVGEFVPTVIMVTGVNGAGKTTSIGKLTRHLANEGASVLLAAADTFRAAAREQLSVWADRNTVEIVSQENGDPAAVSFDAVTAGKARGKDVVLVDTAGRLPTQLHLMDELRKIKRVVQKADATAPHEILLVLDGNTGQNALAQVKAFDDTLQLTGLVVTKLDGTAKGGVLAAIALWARERAARSPGSRPVAVYFIGVGEKLEDLETFNAREFAQALLG